ncbi:MAG: hypothetical protein KGJ13_13025 [Patescibacteria group bacterium]|nr:hypothetical protein [Patescibacteria group bacterium]
MAFNFKGDKSDAGTAKTGTDADATTGVDTPPVGAGPGAAAVGDARAEAKAGLEGRKRGPYKSKHNPDGLAKTASAAPAKPTSASTPSRIPPEVAAQLEAMYSPEIWEPVVEMPFAAAQLVTGHEHWGLDEKSKRVLSVSGSTAARYMGFTNPKWLAINLFLINLLTVATPRLLKELAIRKMEKAKKPEPKPDATRGS